MHQKRAVVHTNSCRVTRYMRITMECVLLCDRNGTSMRCKCVIWDIVCPCVPCIHLETWDTRQIFIPSCGDLNFSRKDSENPRKPCRLAEYASSTSSRQRQRHMANMLHLLRFKNIIAHTEAVSLQLVEHTKYIHCVCRTECVPRTISFNCSFSFKFSFFLVRFFSVVFFRYCI